MKIRMLADKQIVLKVNKLGNERQRRCLPSVNRPVYIPRAHALDFIISFQAHLTSVIKVNKCKLYLQCLLVAFKMF